MSPRMEADFDWGGVQATTPVYPKGDYQLTIKSVRGSAWAKTDANGNPTGVVVEVIRLRPEIVGVYDSSGKLKTELDGRDISGEEAEDVNFWLHSKGGRKMAKGYMMALLGYNGRDAQEEKKFDAFIKKSKKDLGWESVESEDGEGMTLRLGDGWEELFKGKNVNAHMEPETREGNDGMIEQQNYVRLFPVNG